MININWSFNNPLKAAVAFANQKQFWKDFVFIFNSDYLKQRRGGESRGVNEAELAKAVNALVEDSKQVKARLSAVENKDDGDIIDRLST